MILALLATLLAAILALLAAILALLAAILALLAAMLALLVRFLVRFLVRIPEVPHRDVRVLCWDFFGVANEFHKYGLTTSLAMRCCP